MVPVEAAMEQLYLPAWTKGRQAKSSSFSPQALLIPGPSLESAAHPWGVLLSVNTSRKYQWRPTQKTLSGPHPFQLTGKVNHHATKIPLLGRGTNSLDFFFSLCCLQELDKVHMGAYLLVGDDHTLEQEDMGVQAPQE